MSRSTGAPSAAGALPSSAFRLLAASSAERYFRKIAFSRPKPWGFSTSIIAMIRLVSAICMGRPTRIRLLAWGAATTVKSVGRSPRPPATCCMWRLTLLTALSAAPNVARNCRATSSAPACFSATTSIALPAPGRSISATSASRRATFSAVSVTIRWLPGANASSAPSLPPRTSGSKLFFTSAAATFFSGISLVTSPPPTPLPAGSAGPPGMATTRWTPSRSATV